MYGLYTVFSIWELMEQYSTCQTMLISTSIFIGSIGLRELMEGSYGGWHNWFCAHLAERYSCMPPIIYSFIQQTCQILGIKRKLRFSSDLQRFTVLFQSLCINFFCGLISLSSVVPSALVHRVQEVALSLEAVRPYSLTLPPPPPVPSPFCLWV